MASNSKLFPSVFIKTHYWITCNKFYFRGGRYRQVSLGNDVWVRNQHWGYWLVLKHQVISIQGADKNLFYRPTATNILYLLRTTSDTKLHFEKKWSSCWRVNILDFKPFAIISLHVFWFILMDESRLLPMPGQVGNRHWFGLWLGVTQGGQLSAAYMRRRASMC